MRGGGGLDEDDPETLLLETQPAVATEHREDVGGPDQGGDLRVVEPSEQSHRSLVFGHPSGEGAEGEATEATASEDTENAETDAETT